MQSIKTIIRDFSREEDGVALTEYLVLLGILVGGVIGAVSIFAGGLGDTWSGWATWIQTESNPDGTGGLGAPGSGSDS